MHTSVYISAKGTSAICACDAIYASPDPAEVEAWKEAHLAVCELEPCPGCGQAIHVEDDITQCGGGGEGLCCVYIDEPGDYCECGSHDPDLVDATHIAHSKYQIDWS